MPMPLDYQRATEDFNRFLADVIEETGLATRNQAYTTVQSVFVVFRRRLKPRDALRFAGLLPPVLRAIFVADWDVDAPLLAFGSRSDLTREAQMLRQHHNFSPDSAIGDVARALRRHVDAVAFEQLLSTLPQEAADFWAI
ncbi:DUF2267 domain-containing protein [Oryzibacter oryziterrae]|uniref:DUF2267 domain-containing protein n=1 Tax=Oryzibacter oryziterrae TaxID=2766474 RepID=UPI001F48C808|nr:DUF2267 domain-containing protein [Oryzibacter oryziterrae]